MKNLHQPSRKPVREGIDPPIGFKPGQKVSLQITARTKMGFTALVDDTCKGILYQNEIFRPLVVGQKIDGFIKKVRLDKKLDLCLQKPGTQVVEHLARQIMDTLQKQAGFIPLTDKSRPRIIADMFGVSKKSFKKAVGTLYRKRLITLEKDGIRAVKNRPQTPSKHKR